KWESKLRSEYGEAEIFLDTIVQGPPVGAPVTITVSGEDIDELSNIRDDLKNKMLNKGANIVTDNLGDSVPAIEYVHNRDALEDNDISFDVVTKLLQLITQGVPLYNLYEKDIPNKVILKEDGNTVGEEIDLSNIESPSMYNDGPPSFISLDELVSS